MKQNPLLSAIRSNETDAAARSASAFDSLPPPPQYVEPSPPNVEGGETLPLYDLGDYQLLEEIDRGGMGVVYRAYQRSLDRVVAVKMIRDGALAGPEDVARFRSEAGSAARLRHPQIVAIHEVGECQGRQFFSMDYIEGRSLAAHARQAKLSSMQSASIVRDIALAVQAAHDQGILHRDLKPSNVLIDAAGKPHVADFGLAKRIEGGVEWTATGRMLGTPSYMPPEQALGRHSQVSYASDVYALGAILYELLAGAPPFRGESTVDTIRQSLDSEAVSPRRLNPSVSRDLETICLKCLEKQPQRRYPTARELAEELDRLLHDEPIRARPLGALPRAWRWRRRNPALALALLLICLLAVVGPAAAVYMVGLLRRAQVAEANRTDAEIQSLRTASPAAVPQIVNGLRRDWNRVRPQLADLWRNAKITRSERTRLSVALAPEGAPYAGDAFEQLLVVGAGEFAMVLDALPRLTARQTERLWNALADADHSAEALNAAAALAVYDGESRCWVEHAPAICNRLTGRDSQAAASWAKFFEPVKHFLIPELCKSYRNSDPGQAVPRALATELLSSYASDDARLLVELIASADARQFAILGSVLMEQRDRAVQLSEAELDRQLSQSPGVDTSREQAAANLAILLMQMGRPEHVWKLLEQAPDPTIRTYLIHRLWVYGREPQAAIDRLEVESLASVRRAVILALGEADADELPPPARKDLILRLDRLLRTDPDTGVFSAAAWTLRRWGRADVVQSAVSETLGRNPYSPLNRFVNCQGQVMGVVHGPVEFTVEDRTVRIERSFAYALTELTLDQYLQFEASPEIADELHRYRIANNSPGARWYNPSWTKSFGPDPECPNLGMPWMVAVRYCHWLTEREGIPPDEYCFVPRDDVESAVTMAENYLAKTGYRLPTAAEWEFLCRAGAATERFFGRCDELIGEYAWCAVSSRQRTWPVGALKPNDLGLFDIHGNIREWTLTSGHYPPPAGKDGVIRDEENPDRTIEPLEYVLTGSGCYSDQTRFVRATPGETRYHAEEGVNLNGMRLVRTISP